MRAWEFMNEGKKSGQRGPITKNGKHPSKEHEAVMPSAFRMAGSNDKLIELGKIMRAVASSDGKVVPAMQDNWIGLNDTAHPYTKEEAEMLKKAFEAVGIEWEDALEPNYDHKSKEPSGVNITSPVVGFDGYIKKTKKKK
jgi:hypothetical protein